ncbi:MAG: Hpt domain-containing protein [Phycisphaerales bacterium]
MSLDFTNVSPLHSDLANDPDMKELVDLFTAELPERLNQLATAWSAKDLPTIKRISHQLRGSSAGYGFPTLGNAAGALEDSLRTVNDPAGMPPSAEFNVNQLINLCRRVIAPTMKRAA